jgi:hypothetical protein
MTANRTRLGAGRYLETQALPVGVTESTHSLKTHDEVKVDGVLRTVPGARTVVCIMHPRQDVTHHPLVPELLARGFAVWTQGTRSVNNDIALLHEQALLDVAAGQSFLRERDFDAVLTLGHSGGGTLFAYYHEQAGTPSGARLAAGPAGRPTLFAEADMPVPDAAIFMAPHPGQGKLLLRMIDPSVVDGNDPLSVDPQLDPYSAANGFRTAPQSSSYASEFVTRYRQAQRDRVSRIDACARERLDSVATAQRNYENTKNAADRRRALAPRVLTTYRTDADLRGVDLSLDPNDRPYGSLFGRRPDLTNYGLVGFGRFATPEAWLSTWSGLSSQADLVRCMPNVTAPTLLIELTGDQACFPADIDSIVAAHGAEDFTLARVPGTHFGGPLVPGGPTGNQLAASEIGTWLAERFTAAPRRSMAPLSRHSNR